MTTTKLTQEQQAMADAIYAILMDSDCHDGLTALFAVVVSILVHHAPSREEAMGAAGQAGDIIRESVNLHFPPIVVAPEGSMVQ